jgi:hypothetical protein
MMTQINHENKTRYSRRRVFFIGDGALAQGVGLCYDRDYDDTTAAGDATVAWGKRDKVVNTPSYTNNNAFAGVTIQAYSAQTGGQWIDIAEPGSVIEVAVFDTTTTIGENNLVWCIAAGADAQDQDDAGSFTNVGGGGFPGRGAGRVMQTIAAAGLCLVELMDGAESGLIEKITALTLTDGGAQVFMVGGLTFFEALATPATDVTFTLADGTFRGQTKAFFNTGVLTTNDVLVTVTSGEQLDGATDLATLELDGAADASTLIWLGDHWRLLGNAGTALA